MFNKIKILRNFEDLKKLRSSNKTKKIILCHGVFDLMHVGHLYHFYSAKKFGDILVVSITDDPFVNKGPNKPFFNQEERLFALSNIKNIDYLFLNQYPTPIKLIESLKPNFYAKGVEYSDVKRDITGNINKEIKVLEKCGGKILYTEDKVFSSTSIINKINNRDNFKKYLDSIYNNENLETVVNQTLDQLKKKKVLFIGEAILDEYIFTKTLGKSSKESILTSSYLNKETYFGGVYAAINSVSDILENITVITNKNIDASLNNDLTKNKNCKIIEIDASQKGLLKKTRYLDPTNKKIFEVYNKEHYELTVKNRNDLLDALKSNLKKADLVIVFDFGHNFLNEASINYIEKNSKFLCVNAQTNSSNFGTNKISKYKRKDYFCIDSLEAKLEISEEFNHNNILHLKKLKKRNKGNFIVTCGINGCVFLRNNKIYNVPAFQKFCR